MAGHAFRRQALLYALAFSLALGLRLVRLGDLPLNDVEARLALDALHVAWGEEVALSSHVAYTHLTALLFFVFGDSDVLARFWPALAGASLTLVPLLLRPYLRPRPAVVLSFLLAINPGLVALSRQAGGPILALTASLLTVGFWLRRRPDWSGAWLAVTLLSGPALWHGLFGLMLAGWLFSFTLARVPAPTNPGEEKRSVFPFGPALGEKSYLEGGRSLGVTFLATLFALSTLLLLSPQGLSAWMNSLIEYGRGWVTPAGVSVGQIGLALSVYPPLSVLAAIAAAIRSWKGGSPRLIFLSIWTGIALLLTLLYPGRQVADLVWVMLPLDVLAAHEIARHLRLPTQSRLETVGVMAFTVILLAFAWLDLTALYWTPIPSEQAALRLILLLGVVLLLAISLTLMGLGWSKEVARQGALAGAGLMLGLYTLGTAWGATGLRDPKAVELWHLAPPVAQARLLAQTADQVSQWATGDSHHLPVVLYGVDSPALLWTLRHHRPTIVTALGPALAPEMVITPAQNEVRLAAAYRGQDFVWRQTPLWEGFPAYALRWITYRDLPVAPETIVLWVRSDMLVSARLSQP